MASSAAPMSNNIHIATSALDGHLNNIRSAVPPSIKSACFPNSTSSFLRNILLAMGVINAFLLMGTLFSIGVRFMGFTTFLLSIVSCIHVSCLSMVFGNHLADTLQSSSFLGSVGHRLGHVLRNASARYGSDAYVHGALFGSTLLVALLMHVVSSYYGGVSDCVTNAASSASSIHGATDTSHTLTGGYADMHDHTGSRSMMKSSSSHSSFDPYSACGASGPVGFVSFLSGLLFWLDAVLAGVLYVKREEILSGNMSSSSSSSQYDEIGGNVRDHDNEGFDGDFPPSSSTGMRTMHV